MTITSDIDEALAAGDSERAALLAAQIPDPTAYRKAMEKCFAHRRTTTKGSPMFSLERSAAKLKSFNPRTELHGKEGHLAGDLDFEVALPSSVLSDFHPELRGVLFCKRDTPAAGQTDFVNEQHEAPNLRFQQMALPIKWEMELVGAEVTVHYGPTGKGDMTLSGVKVNAFKLTPKEGGTVIVEFRVQANPDEKTAGKLCSLIQAPCEISVEPPDAQQADLQKAAA